MDTVIRSFATDSRSVVSFVLEVSRNLALEEVVMLYVTYVSY
jgi:hypothetical protein